MQLRTLGLGLLPVLAMTSAIAAKPADTAAITAVVADSNRTVADSYRDQYRHPVETLTFFGLRGDQTVVEFQPGGGWYTAILAPLLSAHGHYIGLTMRSQKAQDGLARLIAAGGARYQGASAATLDPATASSSVPDNSADLVLTFRNVHNLTMAGGDTASGTFKAFYKMLKPGGMLGVVDHHLPETADSAAEAKSGYVKFSTLVALAQAAGFRLAGESAVNANPLDTHDWPEGVWTLPPTLQLGDKDRAKYLAIGESDRMTVRFVKPR